MVVPKGGVEPPEAPRTLHGLLDGNLQPVPGRFLERTDARFGCDLAESDSGLLCRGFAALDEQAVVAGGPYVLEHARAAPVHRIGRQAKDRRTREQVRNVIVGDLYVMLEADDGPVRLPQARVATPVVEVVAAEPREHLILLRAKRTLAFEMTC